VTYNVPSCPECGVPTHISREHTWLSDGSIVQTRFRESRIAFLESENWDPIFCSISELIGIRIEPMVIDTCRRTTLGYMRQLVTDEIREMLLQGQLPMEQVFQTTFELVRVSGTADPSFVDARLEQKGDDYLIIRYRNPFSVPLMVGILAGTVESYTGAEVGVVYKRLPPDSIEVKVFEAEHPKELKGRLPLRRYHAVEGGIGLERCPSCGVPQALSKYEWDVSAGIITSTTTGRRMSTAVAPAMIDTIFSELERELTEEVPELAVESQRRFVRNGPYTASNIRNEDDMRRELAVRGLGELKNFKMGKDGVQLTLDQATMHLWIVGLTQGLYELATGRESEVEWGLSEDARLEVNVIPSFDS
jgi:hypothetical protein